MTKQFNQLVPYERIEGHNIPCRRKSLSTSCGMNIRMDEDDETSLRGCCSWCRQRFFTKEKLKRRFPIVTWLLKYSLLDLRGDLIAGLSVAFTIIPQGLALAILAGLPAQYGLYTSFIGLFVYALFGTVKDVAFGPTSILAILIAPFVVMGGTTYAILLSFYTGLLMLILGMMNLGFVVDFVSFPVLSSFSTAAAITIACSQMKSFFGIHLTAVRFLPTVVGLLTHLHEINLWDTFLGVVCLAFLIPLQHFRTSSFFFLEGRVAPHSMSLRIFSKIWNLIVTARNAVVVIICGVIAAHTNVFTINTDIKLGLPPMQIPTFSYGFNETYRSPTQVIGDLAPGILVMALVGLLETVAVANAFMPNKKLDATQELIALGIGNILGSFFSAFPATGSFSRSAVNHNSGVRTPLSGIITGSLVILALATLAPYFKFIPKPALASIIIAAVLPMVKFQDILTIWRANRIDVVPYFITLLSCLFIGLEYGIGLGVTFSLLVLLYLMARPRISIVMRKTPCGDVFLYVKPDRSVLFPSVEYMKVKISKAIDSYGCSTKHLSIVIDGEHMFRADSTFAMSVRHMVDHYRDSGFITVFYNLRKAPYRALDVVFLDSEDFIYCEDEEKVYQAIRAGIVKSGISNQSDERDSHPLKRRKSSHWLTSSVEY
ncbi:sodium-independent sulfate anion transporter [Tetranychus urticae]|uniref:SLC26A/SulP transporter domain-containing protein n=1 Tax=Tetranychus urticae TaxID=32264 RepID=T1KBN0_TETUR|nr:sodium-independent sulfate anion transporter [Tetranychus urticae]